MAKAVAEDQNAVRRAAKLRQKRGTGAAKKEDTGFSFRNVQFDQKKQQARQESERRAEEMIEKCAVVLKANYKNRPAAKDMTCGEILRFVMIYDPPVKLMEVSESVKASIIDRLWKLRKSA
jgi:hypothetical protein